MSSGKISPDQKVYTFEVNSRGVFGKFTLTHIDGMAGFQDRIMISFETATFETVCSSQSSSSVILEKSHTKVLSHCFRRAAELMDKWYKENEDDYHDE